MIDPHAADPQVTQAVDAFVDFYSKNLRSGIFSAFLTLSGFLLSAMTFIILNMKKEVYDHKGHKKRVIEERIRAGKHIKFYAPLDRFTTTLTATIALCMLTSLMQFSLG